MRRYLLPFALLCLLQCAFGTQGSAEVERLSALAAVLNGTTVSAPLKLRFYDREANATISSFTSGANAIVLTSPGEIEIEKLEFWIEPNILAGIFDPQGLWPIQSLSAHEEAGAQASSSTQKISAYSGTTLRDFFLTQNGSDAASRFYFGLSPGTVSLPPGSISRVVLHVKRLALNGTFNGTPFSVLVSQATDPGYSPTCTTTASLRGTGNLIPVFNYQALFSGATGAGSAHLESVFLANLRSTSSGVLSEHFVLSCANLN